MPWNKVDIEFLKSLQHSSCDYIEYIWLISYNARNLELITEYFAERLEFIEHEANLPTRKYVDKMRKGE